MRRRRDRERASCLSEKPEQRQGPLQNQCACLLDGESVKGPDIVLGAIH